MTKIYTFLQNENQKLGLFSSPTGTGKSLSLICSTLSFYLDCEIKGQSDDKTDNWEHLFSAANTVKKEEKTSEIGKKR